MIKVSILHDHSMVLLAPIGYLGRADAKYSVIKKYLEILQEAQRKGKIKLAPIRIKHGSALHNGKYTLELTVFMATKAVEEIKKHVGRSKSIPFIK